MKTTSCMRSLVSATATFLLVASADPAVAEEDDALTRFGDAMQAVLPLTGLAATFGYKDKEGRKQLVKSWGSTMLTVSVLKRVNNKLRPNGANRYSHPSGHTASATSGAAFLQTRYGWAWGVPAYTAAAITAYSRVQADHHFVDDVLAGASWAMFSNWFWVTPLASGVSVAPMPVADGTGVQVQVTPEELGVRTKVKAPFATAPYWRYTMNGGPAYLITNEITSPSSTGDTFKLEDFDTQDDPTVTASGVIEWAQSERNLFSFALVPFESRDSGSFSQPVTFAGETFPADTPLKSAFRWTSLSAQYEYEFLPQSAWSVTLGGALSYQRTNIALETDDGLVQSEVTDELILPLLVGTVGYRFSPRWSLAVGAAGISLDSDRQLDATALLSYDFNYHWRVTGGYWYYARDIETDELTNKVGYQMPYLGLSYTF